MQKIIVILLLAFSLTVKSQVNVKDSLVSVPLIGLHISGQIPFADLAVRYKPSLNVGMPFLFKTKSNFLIGFEGNYFFANKTKEDVLTNMRNPDGSITDKNGNNAQLKIMERGWTATAEIGKIFPKYSPNKNCGIVVTLGAGYMQHKTKLYDVKKTLTQLEGDGKKGYDRLTGGLCLKQYIGYMYLSNKRMVNFYYGLEIFEGFTQGIRGYQYDTMTTDNTKRFDFLVGIRAGWLLPIYGKRSNSSYYY